MIYSITVLVGKLFNYKQTQVTMNRKKWSLLVYLYDFGLYNYKPQYFYRTWHFRLD